MISSDSHQLSVTARCSTSRRCSSKFLALGLPLDRVIEAATIAPARAVGIDADVGTLRPGAFADVAVFALDEGSFDFHDIRMERLEGRRRLRNTLTIVNGRVLEPLAADPPAPWISEDFVWPSDTFHGGIVREQRAAAVDA